MENLTPFNLERAKAGEPICTRDGRKATFVRLQEGSYPFIAKIYGDGINTTYTANGMWWSESSLSGNDLFMASPEAKPAKVASGCIYRILTKTEDFSESSNSISYTLTTAKVDDSGERIGDLLIDEVARDVFDSVRIGNVYHLGCFVPAQFASFSEVAA